MTMKKESCPKCGESGKPVGEITLNTLLKDNEKERIGNGPYFFCQSPSCDLVYFDEAGDSLFKKDALTVRVGIKETEAPRHVCYCFDHTIEEIDEQVTATGESSVLDDIAIRMREACWCETKSPMGSCCMSTVSKYIKAAKANAGQAVSGAEKEEFKDCCADDKEPAGKVEDCCSAPSDPVEKNSNDSSRKLGIFATCGAVFTAILSSACCWLPLLLIAFGASAAGVSGFFEAYRFWFLGATGVLLAVGFYLVYFRREKCAEGSTCAIPNPKLLRFNKAMLWVATIVVALFSFFPNYLSVILGSTNAAESIPKNLDQISLTIEGMTCEGCATSLQKSLSEVDGVTYSSVNFDKKSAVIGIPKGDRISEKALIKAVKDAGYTASAKKGDIQTSNEESCCTKPLPPKS